MTKRAIMVDSDVHDKLTEVKNYTRLPSFNDVLRREYGLPEIDHEFERSKRRRSNAVMQWEQMKTGTAVFVQWQDTEGNALESVVGSSQKPNTEVWRYSRSLLRYRSKDIANGSLIKKIVLLEGVMFAKHKPTETIPIAEIQGVGVKGSVADAIASGKLNPASRDPFSWRMLWTSVDDSAGSEEVPW